MDEKDFVPSTRHHQLNLPWKAIHMVDTREAFIAAVDQLAIVSPVGLLSIISRILPTETLFFSAILSA